MEYDTLINKDNYIDPITYAPDDLIITDENEGNLHNYADPNQKPTISTKIKGPFEEMQNDFNEHFQDIDSKLIVDSGFRSYEYQKKVFIRKISKSIKQALIELDTNNTILQHEQEFDELILKSEETLHNMDLEEISNEEIENIYLNNIKAIIAEEIARKAIRISIIESKKLVAMPGHSEHQSGLAIDVAFFKKGIYTDDTTEDDPEIQWLKANSWKYGFILRYPNWNNNPNEINPITGFKGERWHYRFVGKDLAKFLYNENITLEEYHQKYKKGRSK